MPDADLPSTDEVLDELARLRRGEGIRNPSALKGSTSILRLPIVDDELDRRRFKATDRHLAAWSAIRCVVRHLVSTIEAREILRATLNLPMRVMDPESHEFDIFEPCKERTLYRRIEYLCEILPMSRASFERKYRPAYEQLAGLLVSVEKSPCRSPDSAKQSENYFEEAITAQLLNILTSEHGARMRERLAEAIMNRQPREAVGLLERRNIRNPLNQLGTVISYIGANAWPSNYNESVPLIPGQFLAGAVLGTSSAQYPQLVGRMQRYIDEWKPGHRAQQLVNRDPDADQTLTERYYQMLSRTNEVIADRLDVGLDWSAVASSARKG